MDQAGHVSEDTYLERIDRAEPRFGDLLFSREGTYFGNAAEVPPETRVCLGQRMVLIRPKRSELNTRFLRFWLNSPMMAKHIAGFKDVSVAERLNMPTIRSLPVPRLHPDRQLRIASVLGALDDKIELNRRMNATLETTARAIFKEWFVDFGPTRAKMEGRAPYLAEDIWSLFPDALDEDGKPLGWITSTIGQEAEVVGGSTPSTKEADFWAGEIAWATPKDLSSLNTPVLLSTERQITEAGLSQIGSGLLPVGTVLLSSRAPIGYMAIAQVPVAVNQGFIAMICKKRLSNVFVWLWTEANMEKVHQNANGSTFQEISKANFRPIEVTVAKPHLLGAFDAIVRPLFDQIVSNEKESCIKPVIVAADAPPVAPVGEPAKTPTQALIADYGARIARKDAEKKERTAVGRRERGTEAKRVARATPKAITAKRLRALLTSLRKAVANPRGDKSLQRLKRREIDLVKFRFVMDRVPNAPDAELADAYRKLSRLPMDRNQAYRHRQIVRKLEAPGGPWHRK